MAKAICSIADCGRPAKTRGWCDTHYKRWWKYGDPLVGGQIRTVEPRSGCSVKSCDRKHYSHGRCAAHQARWKKHGDPLADVPLQIDRRKDRRCKLSGCGRRHAAQGYCGLHYTRWKNHGDPNVTVAASPGQADYYAQGYHFIHVNGRNMPEHRHVMEQHLGRVLLPGENVHHRDGDRARNDLANLELWVTRQPKGQRAVDLLAWAEGIVARYGPERDLL